MLRAATPHTSETRRHLDGRRVAAAIFDGLVVLPVSFAIHSIGAANGWLVYAAVLLAYHFLLESLTGQTVGKRHLGLRVVRRDGRPLTALAVGHRTVLSLIDYPLGLLVLALSGGRRQRLGDLAAGTVVVDATVHQGALEMTGRRRWVIVLYPALCCVAAVLVAMHVGENSPAGRYKKELNAICTRTTAELRTGARSFDRLLAANAAQKRAHAAVPAPDSMRGVRERLLTMEDSERRFAEAIRRASLRENLPNAFHEHAYNTLLGIAAEDNAEQRTMGLTACGNQ